MIKLTYAAALAAICALTSAHAQEVKQFKPTGSLPYLSVEESLKTFHLPEGYHLEPVVTDPDISEPVVCAFDGNGRLYVVEMRTYMQDADATGENEKTSRVSMHEDTNGDGRMDKHTVFADGLLLPRMVLPLDDRVLIQETNTLDIYSYRDTNGDGVSDEKKLFHKGGPRGGNMEHQPSGLIWSMDNWLYTTYNPYRLRVSPEGTAIMEPTASNGGQWGLCQDNFGKPWFVNAGGELGPLNFQQPIVYGQFNVPDQFPPNYREVYPLVGLPDVQGGDSRFRAKEKTLNHFTATCGQEIFRGDRLPEDLRGDLLFSEPVGRLIRRSEVEVRDGVTYLDNSHPGSEFIRSTDPNFRAVHMLTGPDGCLYIVDMYRGIIQQGNWTKPGSYLRKMIDQYGLDKNINRGRIYRLVHKDFKPGPQPKLLDETSVGLVAYLAHPNGWWRDTAQKLLVLRRDSAAAGALEEMARKNDNELARMHALWTLEGMGALSREMVIEKMADSSAAVRRASIRVSETLVKDGDKKLFENIVKMAGDKDPEVATQALLTAKLLNFSGYKELIAATIKSNTSRAIKEFGGQMLSGKNQAPPKLNPAQLAQYTHGKEIYESLCFSCHGADGHGTLLPGLEEKTLAPSLVGSKTITAHSSIATKVLLHGLTGPIDGETFTGDMISMADNGEAWIAAVLSYVRNSFGNQLGFVSEAEVKAISASVGSRSTPWTMEELLATLPQSIGNREAWKIRANSNEAEASKAIDGNFQSRYTSGKSMQPGMEIQVELPSEEKVAGLILDCTGSNNDFPRGYLIEVSSDGNSWKKVAKGKGTSARTEIDFDTVSARHIRITQTGKHKLYWSIHELDILRPATSGK